MLKMICLDMDGTIANLYSVPNWLPLLRAFDPAPYADAGPMCDIPSLAELLSWAQASGIEIRIISWLSKESTPEYDEAVRLAKRNWLETQGIPFDHFHGVAYGATKADSIRRYLKADETAILFDDNAKVRQGWHMGPAIDPGAIDIVEYLRALLTE